uniref:Uncharacterized protein n=1 Tax=Panagrolaimus superbus TaxID=310955 RepID=A0A914Y0V4_9BILA
MQKFSGFASLAIFVAGNEEYGFEIQKAIKTYFFQNFVTGKNCKLSENVVCETLVTNELTDVHLSVFSRIINCFIGVFEGNHLKMYGTSNDDQSPTMLLKKIGNLYSPVTKIQY